MQLVREPTALSCRTQWIARGSVADDLVDCWGGIRIANVVIARCGALPWRFSAEDYRAAPSGAALKGPSASACWDAELEAAMVSAGRAVYEEQVLAELLADLAQDSPRPTRIAAEA